MTFGCEVRSFRDAGVKVAIVTNNILHYRAHLYSKLSDFVDLTVIHSGNAAPVEFGIDEKKVACKKVGPFWIQYGLRSVDLESFDAVIYMCDPRWICSIVAFFKYRRKTRSVWWGAWRTSKFVSDRIRLFLLSKSHANIFYTVRHKNEFVERGLDPSNSYVANNTIYIEKPIDSSCMSKRMKFICVGSLVQRKRLDLVVRAIHKLQCDGFVYGLDVVGSGPCHSSLKQLVENLGLQSQVVFHGRLENEEDLAPLYASSLASISPGQAGLSILQSMAFGVPFITYEGAISGGEIENIVDGNNSILLQELSVDAICEIVRAHRLGEIDFISMGAAAYRTYMETATLDLMVSSFCQALALENSAENFTS